MICEHKSGCRFAILDININKFTTSPLQWRHNERDGIWNHKRFDCLLNRLFKHRTKKASKLRVTVLCEGNSPATGEFPAQRSSNAEIFSIWWRHHNENSFGKLAMCSETVHSIVKIIKRYLSLICSYPLKYHTISQDLATCKLCNIPHALCYDRNTIHTNLFPVIIITDLPNVPNVQYIHTWKWTLALPSLWFHVNMLRTGEWPQSSPILRSFVSSRRICADFKAWRSLCSMLTYRCHFSYWNAANTENIWCRCEKFSLTNWRVQRQNLWRCHGVRVCDTLHWASWAHMLRWTISGLLQIMACRLFGDKTLYQQMLTYCHLGSNEQTSIWANVF